MFKSRTELQRQALRLLNVRKKAAEAAEGRERPSLGAPRPPSSVPGVADGGQGAPSTGIDGMALDHRSFVARLGALGLDLPPGYEERVRPLPPPVAPEVQVACAQAREDAERRREAVAARLEEGRVDGNEASPEKAMARLRDFGLDPGQLPADLFRAKGAPLPPPPDAEHALRMADEAALRALNLRVARGERIDVRSLTPDEARAYTKMRGVTAESWEARLGSRRQD